MKVDNKLFRFIMKIFICISITNGSTDIIKSILDVRTSFLSNISSPADSIPKLENSLKIKQQLKTTLSSDDFSNEDFSDQNYTIFSLENKKEPEESQVTTGVQRQREIDSYEELEDVSENENTGSDEIQKDNQNIRTTTKTTLMHFNVAEDASRMISVIGSLEDTFEDPIDDLPVGKIGKSETKMFSKNRDNRNEIELNRILTKLSKKLKKDVLPASKNESTFMNRLDLKIAVNASQIKNVVQILTITKKTKKVINPHLEEKKSFFKYKQALREASKLSLKETTSKHPLQKDSK